MRSSDRVGRKRVETASQGKEVRPGAMQAVVGR